jgi:Tfp pilus assembly protein PilE
MNRMAESTLKNRGDERGFTLIELLWVATLTVLLVATMGMLVIVAARQQPRISDRAASIQEGRALVERFTREFREGVVIEQSPVPTASQITFRTYVRSTACGESTELAPDQPAILCRVTYSCSGGTCLRAENTLTGPATDEPVVLVEGLAGDEIFSYAPHVSNPESVGVRLAFPAEGGDDAVTISDGASLRNTP